MLLSFSQFLISQKQEDTVYIISDPIIIKREFFYAKPSRKIDYSYFHNSINLQTTLHKKSNIEFDNSKFNKLKIKEVSQPPSVTEFSYSRISKIITLSIGLGYYMKSLNFLQEASYKNISDSTFSWAYSTVKIPKIPVVGGETMSLKDSFLILKDSTKKWEYQDKEIIDFYGSQSTIKLEYIYFPIRIGTFIEKNKYRLGVFATLQCHINVSKKGQLIFENEDRVFKKIDNHFFKNNYYSLASELYLGYVFSKFYSAYFLYQPKIELTHFIQKKTNNPLAHSFGVSLSRFF